MFATLDNTNPDTVYIRSLNLAAVKHIRQAVRTLAEDMVKIAYNDSIEGITWN
jgi:hypothetical protein